ncbi:MAG: hypothetical protein IKS29_06630, partial [Oscillospiraceae bacterium]|nr:hypothetical protein [Oscillospiraceae bacterium]
MATTKRKTSGNSGGKRTSSSRQSGSRQAAQKQTAKPIRREVGAFFCLFLAVATVFALFGVEAPFFQLIKSFFRGL